MSSRRVADDSPGQPRHHSLSAGFVAAIIAMAIPSASAYAQSGADFDLSLSMRVVSGTCRPGDTCTFAVAISSFGPEAFSGTLRLRGRFRPGIRAPLAGIGPSGWTCNQLGGDTTCTRETRNLRPGRTLILETAFDLPAGIPAYGLSYCAQIEWERPANRGGEPTVADIQRALAARGYNPGPVDGNPGFGTRKAISQFQDDNGLIPTGHPTREFVERLFRGSGASGDNRSDNDRDCSSTSETPPPAIRANEPPRRTLPQQPTTSPGTPAPLPTIRTPSSSSTAEPATLPPSPALPPRHGKMTSEFHQKQRSGQHDKATSGAIVETQPLAPLGDGAPAEPDDETWKQEFHQKYKSVQHDKQTTTLQKAHTKAISRVVHSKARSVITNPQFRSTHEKALSAYHKKYLSRSHDAATSRSRDGQAQ